MGRGGMNEHERKPIDPLHSRNIQDHLYEPFDNFVSFISLDMHTETVLLGQPVHSVPDAQ
jgi:hypothetical protein